MKVELLRGNVIKVEQVFHRRMEVQYVDVCLLLQQVYEWRGKMNFDGSDLFTKQKNE